MKVKEVLEAHARGLDLGLLVDHGRHTIAVGNGNGL